ncbi:MAG TPA: acyl-CoA dehydrogenase family protein, partial [Acidobacteriaceae bacterium]|nr:acyl-CoA dehydrogenase family protein [Acidobacteriaceae bacterium]
MYSPTLKKMGPFGLETDQDAIAARRGRAVLLAEELADALFAEAEPGNTHPPLAALARLHAAGLMTAALPVRLGGLGLGTEPGGHLPLLRVLSALGGSDLALGRLYEGHVNALILIHAYGSPEQRRIAAEDAHAGKLFAVWNTGEPTPMRVGGYNGNLTLHGVKAFATGAAFAQRPIITAEHRGWQMILPRMESARVADAVQIDRDSWHPLGMESSGSLTIDFSGAGIAASDLIGQPGDFFREPL